MLQRTSGVSKGNTFQKSTTLQIPALRPQYLLPSQRAAFMVDAPTSRAKIPLAALTSIYEMTAKHENFSVLVQCGGRLEFLAALQNKMQQLWPSANIYVTVVNNGNEAQSSRRRSKFALVMHRGKLQPAVPSSVPALRGKAKSYEGLRQRCLHLQCKLRTEEDRKRAEELKSKAEMDPNLAAALARCEICDDDDEEKVPNDEAQSEEECEAMGAEEKDGQRDFITDIFTFSHSTSYYLAFYQQLLNCDNSVITVVMTSTSHPASAVAARMLGQEVFVVTFQSSEHSIAHGVELQDVIFRTRFLETKGVTKGKQSCGLSKLVGFSCPCHLQKLLLHWNPAGSVQQKRSLTSQGLQIIEGPNLTAEEQLVRLSEVSVFLTDRSLFGSCSTTFLGPGLRAFWGWLWWSGHKPHLLGCKGAKASLEGAH